MHNTEVSVRRDCDLVDGSTCLLTEYITVQSDGDAIYNVAIAPNRFFSIILQLPMCIGPQQKGFP